MNRRALLLAVIVAALGALLLVFYVRRFEQEASGGERVKLLAVVKPIDRGVAITDDMLSAREVPQAYVEDRAVKASEKAKIVGLRVGNGVQPGNRAVTVRASSSDDKSHALIRPGDYVDVVATMPTGAAEGRTAVVLLQRVLVLAVGLETAPDPIADKKEGQAQRDLMLTLSLNLQEAQMIALAVEKGRLSVALRNPDDQRIVEGIPDMPASAIMDRGQREKVQSVRRTAPIRLEAIGGAR